MPRSHTELEGRLAALERRLVEVEVSWEDQRRQLDQEHRLRLQQQAAFERQHQFVRLLQTVAVAANEASSVAAALRLTLDQVCAHTGWPVGHAFMVESVHAGRRLVPSGPWHLAEPERYAAFRDATEAMTFEPGQGFPGVVLERRSSAWVGDIAADPSFLRAVPAGRSGLRAGFAFPVLVRDHVVAVLEFFHGEPTLPDDDLLEVAGHVGTLVGRVIERKHAEDALRVTRMQQQALSRRLLEIQELERSRIARELHDQIGQALTAVKLNLEAALHAPATPLSHGDMSESLAAIDHAIEQVRTLSFELRPALLDDLGLAVAVGSYAKRQVAKAGLELRLDIDRIDTPIRKEVETACFRILQEALTNVVRHAQATRVHVALHEASGILVLTISDNGIGFAAETAGPGRSPHGRLGLLGMRERAQNVGGTFQVVTTPEKGTTVRARLPLRASHRLERRIVARS